MSDARRDDARSRWYRDWHNYRASQHSGRVIDYFYIKYPRFSENNRPGVYVWETSPVVTIVTMNSARWQRVVADRRTQKKTPTSRS